MLLSFIEWSVSPEIFHIGPFSIRWYGVLFALGFVVGYFIMGWIYNQEGRKKSEVEQLAVYMIFGTVIGARVGHCLFYNPEFYLSNPIEILKVWEGGLASHGAAIGIIIALFLYAKKKKDISLLWILDRVVIVVALAGSFIRLGNLFNSEIIGKVTEVPWAFIFSAIDELPRHPTQLYESIAYFLIFLILLFIYYKKKKDLSDGLLFGLFLVLVFTFRIFVEFVKENQSSFEAGMTLNMGQILSIPFVIIGFIFILRSMRKKAVKTK
ncbi:MAG: prolipoprotein diacylglyceryl transferase [Ignavibacteria bacterium]|nr:prolipoprotein diacylglyceryl transferase [Ignavibacteria bacterium]